jgi:hypothetical protein
MTSEHIKQTITRLTYKNNTDVVELRWLLLHGLECYASAYKSTTDKAYAFKLLQQHKKLEEAHTVIKDKSRNNTAGKDDFIAARNIALQCMQHFNNLEILTNAA